MKNEEQVKEFREKSTRVRGILEKIESVIKEPNVDPVRVFHAKAELLEAWEDVRYLLAFMHRSFCSYCGEETNLEGKSPEEIGKLLASDIEKCDKRPEWKMSGVCLAAVHYIRAHREGDPDSDTVIEAYQALEESVADLDVYLEEQKKKAEAGA